MDVSPKESKSKVQINYQCEECGKGWVEKPTSKCPGTPIYSWEPWPEDLFTRKQLAAKKLNPGPLAGVIPYDKSGDGDGWLRLYRESEVTPKPALSPKTSSSVGKNASRCVYVFKGSGYKRAES